ncbi:MAG: B-box zinc finger protein [Candidatus Acidoferrales bacterium]|nr:B-box zinc finger protein [Candidatus Acidoferrales bacterium]
MKCAQHADVEATGYCRQCGKPLCPACTRDVQGALYCESCLASIVSSPQAAPAGTTVGTHPGTALALGFIPGLGAVYNGEYVKALIHVLAFGGMVGAQTADLPVALHVILGIGLGCFYFYMPIEAYRTAKAHRSGEPQRPDILESEGRKPIGAIVLIALGVLFLLANFHVLDRDWFSKVWPAGLILLGVWILFDRMRRTS